MENNIRKIAILTSGGDAPGMNAVIRAVVRSAVNSGLAVKGINRGYEGLLSGDIVDLNAKSVSDIMQRGGTIIKTARSAEMMKEDGQKRAAEICKVLGIEALIIIGGDGSLKGAQTLSSYGVNVIGIPATIDLDFACSDYTVGFDTAVNTAMDAITKIKDTSNSHERCSVVEVMGRDCGAIALWCALTCGAEEVLIPEKDVNEDEVIRQIIENRAKGKKHNLIVVAEGVGGTVRLAKRIEEVTGIETRASILGYLQRGGSPTALDRVHGSMMGYKAVESILNGEKGRVIVFKDGKYESIDINEALKIQKNFDRRMYDISKTLSI